MAAISPDGQWLAFIASYEGAPEAYVMPLAGGLPKRLTFANENARVLGWTAQGEVLVATSTGPTFNVVLPLIGALITERGGVLSHAAIVSREYGLPGVVGCAGATKQLQTGMRVRVDGASGDVWMLS